MINFGREICGALNAATMREWLVTNGMGGYACGTLSGLLTRRYHGLLIAALNPPVQRTLLVSKLEETFHYHHHHYSCYTNRWRDGTVEPRGYHHIERFHLEGMIPVWTFACGDAVIEKRIWMQHHANTTYIRYDYLRGTQEIGISLAALVNYRDHHGDTQNDHWRMSSRKVDNGIQILAFAEATPFYLLCDRGNFSRHHHWCLGFDLAVERYRGLKDSENHLHIATFSETLKVGESLTLVATTDAQAHLDGNGALNERYDYEKALLTHWHSQVSPSAAPAWIEQLVLASDQFIVTRSLPNQTDGKTIIAGYPWFSDWGRDTAISLPGLTLATGQYDIARQIILTFSEYLDQGMLPNMFPDGGEKPLYNTVDAIFWYFEAIRAYYDTTADIQLIQQLFPILEEVIQWHREGTRYNIHLDTDGLIYAGESGVQLTWMDAKVGNWVVTPRIGKPVEINALWYNTLVIMARFADILGESGDEYQKMAKQTRKGFKRFWRESLGYCCDVLDTPTGEDTTLRPNQIFAVSLPPKAQPLLTQKQQKAVVDQVSEKLITSYGLRSLSPYHFTYQGHYGGDRVARDGAYHQGTTWGWLIGHFVQAHLKVYQDPALALSFLEPMQDHLQGGCVGTISEIFDGDAPFKPRGCFAQGWSVAEVLRAWLLIIQNSK